MKKVARLLPIVIMVLLVAALGVSPVLANPGHEGGHGKGGKGGDNDTTSTGTLSVSPEAPLAYSVMTLNGTDFAPNSAVRIQIQPVWCCIWSTVMTDGSGSFSVSTKTSGPGDYEIWAYRSSKNGKQTILGYLGFPVGDQH